MGGNWLGLAAPIRILLIASAVADLVTLIDGPYRTELQATVPVPNRFMNATSGVSYQGWFQFPSASSPLHVRSMFHVQTGTTPLLSVFLEDDQRLCVNLTTASGPQLFRALNLTADSWISFGISISSAQLGIYANILVASSQVSQVGMTASFPLPSSPVLLSPATATVPALSPTQLGPVSDYLLALRVMAGALTVDQFNAISTQYPSPYLFRSGADSIGLVFERATPLTNATCAGTFVVRAAMYGRPFGLWPQMQANPNCDSGDLAMAAVQAACQGKSSCIIPESNADFNVDPCSGRKKFIAFALTCVQPTTEPPSTAPLPRPSSAPPTSQPVSSLPPPPTPSSSSAPSPSSRPSTLPPSSSSFPSSPGSRSLSTISGVVMATRSSSAMSPSPIPSASPSRLQPRTLIDNVQAWQITLHVSTSTLGPGQYALRNALIRDLAAVLNVPTSRFVRVEFRDQTETSTLLAIVIVVDAASDPDGTLLVDSIVSGLQTPGSSVRSVTILIGAPPPPVPVEVVQIRLQDCDLGPCPATSTSSTSAQDTRLIWIGAVIAACVIMTVVVCCWVRVAHSRPPANMKPMGTSPTIKAYHADQQGTDPGESTQATAVVTFGPSGSASVWGQTQSVVDGAPYPPVIPVMASGAYPAPTSMRPDNYGSYFSQNDLSDIPLEMISTNHTMGVARSPSGSSANRTLQQRPVLPDF